MTKETAKKGIGAALHLNGETKAMRDFFSTLKNFGIQTIDPNHAHVTIVDCAETAITIFSERDQAALNKARAEASRYLASLPLSEIVLQPDDPELEIFGRRLGVAIANREFISDVRSYVGGIFYEEANITLSNRTYVPHMTAGLKTRGLHGAVKRIKNARIPRSLHVIGHNVSERIYYEQPGRQRAGQSFVNKPALRSVS